MTTWIKQSTARTIPVGPIVDSTDGATAETAFTVAQADIRLSKNGGAFAQTNNVAGASHMENGYYGVPLDATDTNTLGELVVNIAEAGGLQVWVRCMVVSASAWDFLFGSTALPVNMTQILGTAVSAPATAGILDVNIKNIDNDAASASGTVTFPNATLASTTNITAGTITTATTATNVTTLNGIAANVITAASINTGAITAAKFAAGAIDAAAVATGAIDADALAADAGTEIGTAVWATAARTLTANTNLNDPTAAVIADAVWDEARAGHVAAGSYGEGVTSVQGNVTGSVASVSGAVGSVAAGGITAASIATDAIDSDAIAASAVTEIQSGLATSASIAALNNLSAAAVNAEVVDALATDTYAEPGAVPAATASLTAKIGWLFTLARNKVLTTGSAQVVRNDADSADVATATVADDATTLTRGKFT